MIVVSVCIISELFGEDWCFHYVGEPIKAGNNSYLIISILLLLRLPLLETSTREPARAIGGIRDGEKKSPGFSRSVTLNHAVEGF